MPARVLTRACALWQVREWLKEQLDKLEPNSTPPTLLLSHYEMEGWADGGGGGASWSVSGCRAYRRHRHRHRRDHLESVGELQNALDTNLRKQRALGVEEASLRECLERLISGRAVDPE